MAAGQEVPPLQAQIVDARPPGRFRGVEPEPRPGLKRGHMPGALNVPFVQVRWVLQCLFLWQGGGHCARRGRVLKGLGRWGMVGLVEGSRGAEGLGWVDGC